MSSPLRARRRPFTVISALVLTLGAGALIPAATSSAAPCGRASGCTKFELISAASTYDWWPWGKDPKSSIARYEFRTADGDKAPKGWTKAGAYDRWVVGAAGNGTLASTAPVLAAGPVQQFSTGWATGRKTGRWEIRFRSQSKGEAAGDYRVQAELVPSGSIEKCEAKSITMVAYDPSAPSTAKLGVTRPGVALGAALNVTTPPLNTNNAGWTKGNDPKISGWHVWAVEVKPTKISWFLDGRIVRREVRKAAMFNEYLSMRISLLSDAAAPTSSTRTQLDWARWFSLKRTTKNKALVKQLQTAKPLTTISKSVNPGCG